MGVRVGGGGGAPIRKCYTCDTNSNAHKTMTRAPICIRTPELVKSHFNQ